VVLQSVFEEQRAMSAESERSQPPHAAGGPPAKTPPPPARLVRRLLQKAGLHPDDPQAHETPTLNSGHALVVCTNQGMLDIGKPTGVFASEMTAPYYVFLDTGMEVDVASPKGGVIPVDPQSLRAPQRCAHDDRFLADDELKEKVDHSLAVGDLDMADYDIVYLAGGWGAAFDFGFSDELAGAVTDANALGRVIGGVCHGPLGLRNATGTDGRPLVAGRKVSAVTDKQVHELGIDSTPHHPETELRAMGAEFESATKRRDALANHWVVDGNLVTGQNQNAAPMVARELVELVAAKQNES
jgi:putative intracellular protease/amidase